MHPGLRDFGVEDRNGDGIVDAITSKVYVPDDATPDELTAAANLAARLAFETVSMDLPVGASASTYAPGKEIAILIGRVAAQAGPNAIALSDIRKCEGLSRSLGSGDYSPGEDALSQERSFEQSVLGNPFQQVRHVSLGPEVRSTAVIDLAARIALESTEIRIPLVSTTQELAENSSLPEHVILVGLSNPHVARLIRSGKFDPPHVPGTGSICVVDDCIVIAGADAEGEAAALQHAALRMPYLWFYGKGERSIESIEREVRTFCPYPSPKAELVFDETYRLDWEVDAAIERIQNVLLPVAGNGESVDLELRLSEPLEVRRKLSVQLHEILKKAGIDIESSSIRVLSAHKQGFCWIDEQLKPDLRAATQIRIRVRKLAATSASIDPPDRWLHELYPIDEILARDIGLPIDQIIFEQVPATAPHVYEVLAEGADGRTVLHSTFDPKCLTRPLFDIFPDYANSIVATGWLRASVAGRVVIDERIKTDYECFWDEYQRSALPRIRDYVLRLHGGKPQPESAPHFDELSVEVQLSEPDYSLGLDQERISTLEALHEDIYFETLLFFEILGASTCGKPLKYPGRIVPRVKPTSPGPGYARVRFTGYATPYPHEKPFADQNPIVTSVSVNADGVLSAEILAGIRLCWLLSRDAQVQRAGTHESETTLVPLDQPISPEECERIIGKLARFPEVRPFVAGRSWMGHNVWAMDVTAPYGGKYFSQTKAAATKPCLFITGRQHANEVSSTSHILRLVELLVTRAEDRQLLNRVNFLIHPITNPDGAALVDELHALAPDFMLHAGYLGALGVDVTEEQWSNAPKYPEAHIRPELWRMSQPDIVLNPHGYPSHEWVQLFAGYTAWVKSRQVHARDWWIPRGWFIPRFDFVEDERFPRHRRAALLLRDRIAAAIRPTFGAVNERMYRRYTKYVGCRLDLHAGVLIQSPSCGSKKDPKSFGFMTRHPEITFFESLSEAPDEVASGDWLKTLAAAGLEVSLAHARFLAELPDSVVRTRRNEGEVTIFQITRTRLPAGLPGADE